MQTAITEELINSIATFFTQQQNIYGESIFLELPDFSQISVTTTVEDKVQDKICNECVLAKTRKTIVAGAGNENATFMLIGDVPSTKDDSMGIPFLGDAGDLLTKILVAIGFRREEIYLSNIIKCRPPNGREPRFDEMRRCLPRLEQEISLVKPKMILALGKTTARILLNCNENMEQLRNKFHNYRNIPLMVTYHPTSLLKKADLKRTVWEDVQKFRKEYDIVVGDKPAWRRPQK
ncbi:uracil-DNA glycosylase [bacterium]|nr:uracil-DNA glycosylase [bacterium]